jgi:hypothetical protein
MISKKIILGTLGGLIVLASTSIFAAQMQTSSEDVIAREASEGPRGGDNERPGDRQRRGGRMSIDGPSDIVVAREASEGPRGGDNERPGDRQRRGGRKA